MYNWGGEIPGAAIPDAAFWEGVQKQPLPQLLLTMSLQLAQQQSPLCVSQLPQALCFLTMPLGDIKVTQAALVANCLERPLENLWLSWYVGERITLKCTA